MIDLVLASGSPRRRQLLQLTGLRFDVEASGAAEPAPEAGEEPGNYACRLAASKAALVAARRRSAWIVAADTLIDFEGRILGKPEDPADARRMLGELAGKAHRVVTGICVTAPEDPRSSRTSSVGTIVRMAAASAAELAAYVATGEPLDKAGSYGIQGAGGRLVSSIDGCYYNVVGLPLCEVMSLLTAGGAVLTAEFPCRLPDDSPCPRLRGTPGKT